MFNWQGDVLLAHHSPHMRAGEIQDESSKHEHQKVHERYLSKTCGAVNRVYSQHKWLCMTDKNGVDC